MTDWLSNIHGRNYDIIVVEQSPEHQFNKGALFNSAFLELQHQGYDYIIFHDVDQLPTDARLTYRYPSERPIHLCSDNYQRRIGGGAIAFTLEQYVSVNGFSNKYWSWGVEDDDIWVRIEAAFGVPPFRLLELLPTEVAGNNVFTALIGDRKENQIIANRESETIRNVMSTFLSQYQYLAQIPFPFQASMGRILLKFYLVNRLKDSNDQSSNLINLLRETVRFITREIWQIMQLYTPEGKELWIEILTRLFNIAPNRRPTVIQQLRLTHFENMLLVSLGQIKERMDAMHQELSSNEIPEILDVLIEELDSILKLLSFETLERMNIETYHDLIKKIQSEEYENILNSSSLYNLYLDELTRMDHFISNDELAIVSTVMNCTIELRTDPEKSGVFYKVPYRDKPYYVIYYHGLHYSAMRPFHGYRHLSHQKRKDLNRGANWDEKLKYFHSLVAGEVDIKTDGLNTVKYHVVGQEDFGSCKFLTVKLMLPEPT